MLAALRWRGLFAALLGTPGNGHWAISPGGPVIRVSRSYRAGSLVLETLFHTAEGSVALIDFMPPFSANSSVVRIVEGRGGTVRIRMELVLRFDYGASVPWVTRLDEGHGLRAIAGPDMVVLRTRAELRGEGLSTVSEFTVSEGEQVPFVLTHGPSHLDLPHEVDPASALRATDEFWSGWTKRCTYRGEWSEAVTRSLITLKALTYVPTGGVVAAPTTSLPEQPGGSRNWDYRFCWLRDATFTLLAMLHAGYVEEARAWRAWLHRSVAGSPDQIADPVRPRGGAATVGVGGRVAERLSGRAAGARR